MVAGEQVTHPELRHLRDQLRAILCDMVDFGPTVSKPPVLDSSFEANQQDKGEINTAANHEPVPGLRSLRESVQRDLDVLEKVSDLLYGSTLSTARRLTTMSTLQ